MEEVTISELRTHCYAILRRVNETGRPVIVTRYGKPIGQIAPPPQEVPRVGKFGCMAGTAEIVGDIVEPLGTGDWEVYRE